jgi:integrase
VAFCRAIAEGPDGLVVVHTKNRRRHCVEIDDATLAALRCFRWEADQRAAAVGVTVAWDGYVFARDPGGAEPWRPNWVTKQFTRLRADVGLAGYRLHDLRHFMATEMLAAGVPIATVSQRLSHARASTTLNVYAHAIPGGDQAAAETLAAILGAASDSS